jgi:hypothetical protein
MQVNKNQYGRAMRVIPSDTVNIPNPSNKVESGVSTATVVNGLVSSGSGFSTNMIGYIVVNETNNTIANIIGFSSDTLLLDDDIFVSGDGFSIYSPNETGCVLYIPAQTPANLSVVTVGGDSLRFTLCGSETSHTILPVNVLMVTGTDLENLVALW